MLMAVLMIVSLVPAVSAAGTCNHDKTDMTDLSVKLDAAAKQPGIELTYCTKCDDVVGNVKITPFAEANDICSAGKHSFVTVELQAANCVERGVKVSYCSVCGTAATTPVILTEKKDLGHVYTNFVVAVEPTCTADGYGYTLCDVCGEPAFVANSGAVEKLMPKDSTKAAIKANTALFAATNPEHANTDVFVKATEDTYKYTWEKLNGDVGYLKATKVMWAADEATHAQTVNGKAIIDTAEGTVTVKETGSAVNAWATTNEGLYDNGYGNEATKYCADCGLILKSAYKEVKGLNETHEMTLSQAGYYPYFDATNGVKHDGVTDVWYCETCGTSFGGETLPYATYYQYKLVDGLPKQTGSAGNYGADGCVVGDTWVVGAEKPSCEKAGKTGTTYTLTKDKGWQVSADSEEIPATGHDLVKIESKEATCQEYGWDCTDYYYCYDCGYHQGLAVLKVAKTTCSYQANVLVPATCKNTGLAVQSCVWCNALKLGSDNKVIVTTFKTAPCTAADELANVKEATCTEPGYTGDKVCKWCGDVLVKGEATEALGHTEEAVEAVAATCTEAGTTAGTKCSVCGEVLSGCEAVDALGHTFDKGVCTVCGAEDPDYVAPVAPEFTDAKDIAPYAGDAVAWAVANGIVNGRDDGSFDPKANVTRAELVVMLWRQAGEPESTAKVEFTDAADIPEYAVKAVAWAVEKGIVTGYEDNTFKPTADVTRAEFVKMLYGMVGTKVETAADFSDVVAGEWYVDAINWAAAEEVTTGRDDGTFGVADNATREEAVTFLYRAFAE